MQNWEHEPCGCDEDKAYDDGVKKGARDMRERCADEAYALASPEETIPPEIRAIFMADPETACRNLAAAVQERIAAAIRGLEL